MSTTAEDVYFDLAVQNARKQFGPSRKTTGPTHWSYHDAPQWALCGEHIEPEQFANPPTCPECLAELARMQTETIR